MGLEDNADFWDMGIDDEGEERIPIMDLTKQQSQLHRISRDLVYLLKISL